MKAMIYYGANDIRFEEREKPAIIETTDVLVRMVKTTICGTDLGIWKGKNPEIEQTEIDRSGVFNGRILGHEGIGMIEEVGSAVKNFKNGDKVILSCVSRCGTCENCQKQLYAHCRNGGGWIFGYMIDGTQAEYVRVPFADNSLYLLPPDLDEDVAVMLSDALPTAHEIGVQNGNIKPGDTVAIIGAGPVGMGCLLTAQLYSPSRIIMVDLDDNRLALARELGATDTINSGAEDAAKKILELTDGRGVDCAIEAVGTAATWNICQLIAKEGGHVANVGVHGHPVEFSLEKLWIRNLTITTGLVNTNTTAMLLKTCCAGKFPMQKLVTHHFAFADMPKAYDVFKNSAAEKAMKVVIDF
ncbi:TPA: zinc-dependent alcohol dehydrogenase family protein [Pseudomonas putida]|uniref:zinc-dependent alcohol dehydrogenase family protein n=1 Tax=Pseudomonas aeruginosa TaxID=287 RepID=UPI00053D9EE9|nr:zinc-dependent alcohol dehydrogenase family protein [Pseudomonas aeruginosa]MBG6979290.1 zinc-dependent alcohol dehydrogenase family protein [Pseudomonas aeruginosa]HBN9494377.1 zinc-dependent alcohol dehydrogenase family protein [Pseudomonas aeruginosa]